MNDGKAVLFKLNDDQLNRLYPGELPEWRLRWRLRAIQHAFLIEGIVRRNRRQLEQMEQDYLRQLARLP